MSRHRRLFVSNEGVGASDLVEAVKDAEDHPAFDAMDDHTQALLNHTEEVHQMADDSITAVDLDEHLENVQAIQDESAAMSLSLSVLPIVEALRMRHDSRAKRRSVTLESLQNNHRRGMNAVRESLGETIAQLWHKIWEFIKKSGEFIMSLVKAAIDWVTSLFTNDKASHLTSSDSRGISGLIDKIKNAASDNEAIQMLGGRATTESYVASMERDITGAHTQAQKAVASIRQNKAFFSKDDLRTAASSGVAINKLVSGKTTSALLNLDTLATTHYHVYGSGVSGSKRARRDMDDFMKRIKVATTADDVQILANNINRADSDSLLFSSLVGVTDARDVPSAELAALLKHRGQVVPDYIDHTADPLIGIGYVIHEQKRVSSVQVHRVSISRSDIGGDGAEEYIFKLFGDAVTCLKKSKERLTANQNEYKARLEDYKHLGKLLTEMDLRKFQNEEVSSDNYATICKLPKILTAHVRAYAIDLEGMRNHLAACANIHNALVPMVLFLDRKAKEKNGYMML